MKPDRIVRIASDLIFGSSFFFSFFLLCLKICFIVQTKKNWRFIYCQPSLILVVFIVIKTQFFRVHMQPILCLGAHIYLKSY